MPAGLCSITIKQKCVETRDAQGLKYRRNKRSL